MQLNLWLWKCVLNIFIEMSVITKSLLFLFIIMKRQMTKSSTLIFFQLYHCSVYVCMYAALYDFFVPSFSIWILLILYRLADFFLPSKKIRTLVLPDFSNLISGEPVVSSRAGQSSQSLWSTQVLFYIDNKQSINHSFRDVSYPPYIKLKMKLFKQE